MREVNSKSLPIFAYFLSGILSMHKLQMQGLYHCCAMQHALVEDIELFCWRQYSFKHHLTSPGHLGGWLFFLQFRNSSKTNREFCWNVRRHIEYRLHWIIEVCWSSTRRRRGTLQRVQISRTQVVCKSLSRNQGLSFLRDLVSIEYILHTAGMTSLIQNCSVDFRTLEFKVP